MAHHYSLAIRQAMRQSNHTLTPCLIWSKRYVKGFAERRRTSCIKQCGYKIWRTYSAIKTTQNEFKWHIDNYNTIFWKLPDVTHFRSAFYGPVHACQSAQRAINNVYSSLGVPERGIPLRHKYAKQAFYDTWAQVYRWLIFYITPLSDGTPANIRMYFIFLENKSPGLHFAADNIGLSSVEIHTLFF